ncbi:MAG: peptidase M16 [Alphaproteobacteria bacterium CG_4_10_14_0_8_um_filter_53_9]|nr:MAG: peptidase M16 [Alphaproteobacteria bacterium CG_4_10_14_0_8_um_filter_53_9]
MTIQTETLKNGMNIVVVPDHRAPVVTHSVWYRIGSVDEPAGLTGISHMLEHLMFKGTKNFGPGVMDKLVQKNGGIQNAFTSRDMTAYHQTIAKEKLPLMMEIEADRVNNLDFPEELFTPEKQVVSEERKLRTESQPMPRFFERMLRAHFPTHPYGQPVIGWRTDLDAYTREKALDWYSRNYAANNATLIVVGDMTLEELKPLADKYYAPLPTENHITPRVTHVEPLRQEETRYIAVDKDVQVPVYYHIYRAPSSFVGIAGALTSREDVAALHVLAEVLGGGDTARLYQSLVMEKDLADSASADYDSIAVTEGTFDIYVSPKEGVTLDKIEAAAEETIAHLIKNGLTEKELKRAIVGLKASEIYAQDDADGLMYRIGSWLMAGGTAETYTQWLDDLDHVTTEQVQAAAKKYLIPAGSTTGIIVGDKKQLGTLQPTTPAVVQNLIAEGLTP